MRVLLDTHAFLWSHTSDPRLSRTAQELIADGSNEVFLSAVTAWEIAIKYARGRLPLPEPPGDYVGKRVALQGLTPLPIEIAHAIQVAELPNHHRDPFDRLLIAQAQVERVPILSSDVNFGRYEVEVVW